MSLKLIFVHGVNHQSTNYSGKLFDRIMKVCHMNLTARGLESDEIRTLLNQVTRHEVLWADLTADLTNRYCQLQYHKHPLLWGIFTKNIDPLAMQIMRYIKDKGDKEKGQMNILREIDSDIERIFTQTHIGNQSPNNSKDTIFIAHSLGSVIAFDYIFCFRDRCRLDQNVNVQAFITMGSPISLFTSAMGYPDSELTLPPNVQKWVNIISPRDCIARYAKPHFKNIPIIEKEVHTSFFPMAAHCHYWKSSQTAAIIAQEVIEALNLFN